MIVSDRNQIRKSGKGVYPDIKCLYSNIPRDMRMHMYRVAQYAQVLFTKAKELGVWDDSLPEDIFNYSKEIFQLHDIGRCFVPIDIYNKVEELSNGEMEEIKKHTMYAVRAESSVYFAFFPERIMPYFRDVAMMHHERIDGTGYPFGMKGDEIPFMAKVCAIADAYDGMTSWKAYKESMTSEQAMNVLIKESGRQFQPELVECFVRCRKEIELIDLRMNGM